MERSDDKIRRYSLIFLRIDRITASLVRRAFSVFPRVSERLLRSFPSFVKKKKKKGKERGRGEEEREKDGWEGRVEVGKTRNAGLKEEKCTDDSLRGFYIPREPRIFLDTGS